MQMRKKSVEKGLNFRVDRIEEWVHDARPDSVLATDSLSPLPSTTPAFEPGGGGRRLTAGHEPAIDQHEVSPLEMPPMDRPPVSPPNHQPPPPPQGATSPWTNQVPSSNHDGTRLWYPLRLHVTTKTEVTEATLTSSQSFWAVAQIHAECPALPASMSTTPRRRAVAIVLDNS